MKNAIIVAISPLKYLHSRPPLTVRGEMGFDTSVGSVSGILPQRSSRVHAGLLFPAECSITLDNVAAEQLRRQKNVRRHMHMSTFSHAATYTRQHSLSLCSVMCIILVRAQLLNETLKLRTCAKI